MFEANDGEKAASFGTIAEAVYKKVEERKENPVPGSYTCYLFEKGIDKILKKVGEESTEVVIAAKNNDKKEIVYEISDLIYHLTVLMKYTDVTFDDIAGELMKRFK